GVLVVAAAGNHASTRPFYPAAFAGVLAVGALNPNGTKALFSNDGSNVHWWATGAGVVSTYPSDVRGSFTSTVRGPRLPRATLNPDDFDSGFAVWDGTSFGAPLIAAHLANELLAGCGGKPLVELTEEATRNRAADAVARAKCWRWGKRPGTDE